MNPSASQLPRALACPASFALPPTADAESAISTRGSGVHGFIAQARVLGRDEALALIPEDAPHRLFCEQLPLDELPQGGEIEVAVAWNSRTDEAVVLGKNIGRAYKAAALAHGIDLDLPEWWFGTIDLIGTAGGWLVIVDWKTGFRSSGAPSSAEQLLFGALAGSRLTGLDRAKQAFFYLNEEGRVRPSWGEADSLDLADFAERLREWPARHAVARGQVRRGEQPEVHAGTWCAYCPAIRNCPARMESIARMHSDMDSDRALLQLGTGKKEERRKIQVAATRAKLLALTPEAIGAVVARAKEYRDVAQLVIDAGTEIARATPLPLPNGKVLREAETALPTSVNAEIAEQALIELHGPEIAAAAVRTEKTATLTSIENALRPIAPPRGLAKLNAEALRQIRRRGGLAEGSVMRVREVKP